MLLCAVIFANLIIWGVFGQNLFLGILLFISSIVLCLKYLRNNFLLGVIFFILLSSSIITSLKYGFDYNLLHLTHLESDTLLQRHEYFASELGRLYKNRIGINYATSIRPKLVKFNRNLFSHLDFEYFFNAQKLGSFILLPLFFLGFFKILKKIDKFLVFCLIVIFIAGGFLAPTEYGYLPYIPFVNLAIYLGLLQLLQKNRYVKI